MSAQDAAVTAPPAEEQADPSAMKKSRRK